MYDEGAEPRLHEIFLKGEDADNIFVRITDYGKANLKNRTDNLPALQIWTKLNNGDLLISKLKSILLD